MNLDSLTFIGALVAIAFAVGALFFRLLSISATERTMSVFDLWVTTCMLFASIGVLMMEIGIFWGHK